MDKGIVIVRDLLEGKIAEADTVISRAKTMTETRRSKFDAAREAKLWCLLGDLEPENALQHYTKAWEVSAQTSGRAMRSLGGHYFAQGDFPNTIACLRRATAINPLLVKSWFILGCACVREEDWKGARDAFVRCVTIDDEDGESWNNLASVYLQMGTAENDQQVSCHSHASSACLNDLHSTTMLMIRKRIPPTEQRGSRSRTKFWPIGPSSRGSNTSMKTGACGTIT